MSNLTKQKSRTKPLTGVRKQLALDAKANLALLPVAIDYPAPAQRIPQTTNITARGSDGPLASYSLASATYGLFLYTGAGYAQKTAWSLPLGVLPVGFYVLTVFEQNGQSASVDFEVY